MGARQRWKSGDLTDSALVGARQRWWAMIQVVIQLSHHTSRRLEAYHPDFIRMTARLGELVVRLQAHPHLRA